MRRTLFINVTGRCNLDCERCYLYEGTRSSRQQLDVPSFVEFLRDPAIQNSNGLCVWQGGEITLVNPSLLYGLSDALREEAPSYGESAVSNLLATTDGHIEFFLDRCSGSIDSTFALKQKRTKGGDSEAYLDAFRNCSQRYYDAGVKVSVNIELNREMIDLGVELLVEYLLTLPPMHWEFDFSIDFASYLQAREFTSCGTPLLPLTTSYASFWKYVRELESVYPTLACYGHTIGFFESDILRGNTQFGAGCTDEFFTLNVDGSVTTNPLYSDIPEASIANPIRGLSISSSTLRRSLVADEIARRFNCVSCEFFSSCKGGPSHVPVVDGSGECAGGIQYRRSLRQKAMGVLA